MYRPQLVMPARDQRLLQKFLQSLEMTVMRTRDLCQRVVALARKMTSKTHGKVRCHVSPSVLPLVWRPHWMVAYQQPHVNKQELWMQPCELYELEGTLYNEICIVLAGSWLKAICTIRPCNRTLPFNLQYLCITYHCWVTLSLAYLEASCWEPFSVTLRTVDHHLILSFLSPNFLWLLVSVR